MQAISHNHPQSKDNGGYRINPKIPGLQAAASGAVIPYGLGGAEQDQKPEKEGKQKILPQSAAEIPGKEKNHSTGHAAGGAANARKLKKRTGNSPMQENAAEQQKKTEARRPSGKLKKSFEPLLLGIVHVFSLSFLPFSPLYNGNAENAIFFEEIPWLNYYFHEQLIVKIEDGIPIN